MQNMTGYCPGCGTRIMDVSGRVPQLLENHHRHYIQLSNGTIMPVGVCTECKEKLVQSGATETAEKILESHKIHWSNPDNTAPRGFEDFSVISPNRDVEDFKRERKAERRRLTEDEIVNLEELQPVKK